MAIVRFLPNGERTITDTSTRRLQPGNSYVGQAVVAGVGNIDRRIKEVATRLAEVQERVTRDSLSGQGGNVTHYTDQVRRLQLELEQLGETRSFQMGRAEVLADEQAAREADRSLAFAPPKITPNKQA